MDVPYEARQDKAFGDDGCGTRILRVIHGRDARATSNHRLKSVLLLFDTFEGTL